MQRNVPSPFEGEGWDVVDPGFERKVRYILIGNDNQLLPTLKYTLNKYGWDLDNVFTD
jgi:hypothetical protein